MLSPAFRAKSSSAIDVYDPTLKLYLPFYDHATGVSPFISKDLNHHTATVTGATWGLQGRKCDGNDDVIHIPDHATLKFGTGDFTASFWVKTTQSAGAGVYPILFSKEDEVASRQGWTIYQFAETNYLTFAILSGGTEAAVNSTYVINDGNWHLIQGVKTSTLIELFVDTVSKGSTAHSLGSTDKAIQVNIGGNDNANRWSSGLFGEALLHGKALSAGEMAQYHQSTKWRYA